MEVRQPPTDLLEHLAVAPSSPCRPASPNETVEQGAAHSIATLDILPTNKQNLCVPVTHVSVSEINAENGTGVNRVIADFAWNSTSNRQKASSSSGGIVPRVPRLPLKRGRAPLRRGTPYWTMLHRSRPDLIKGIGSRGTDAPSTSRQTLTDALSQSTSDNSLHSSGSADFRPRLQAAASLSRTSSVGDASGGSSPTQSHSQSKPIGRKKEVKRAEIVASVTSRLYAIKKKPDPRMEALQAAEKEDEEDDELEELKLCKRARMKLFDLSRKLAMAKKVKRVVDSDTQTESSRSTLRLKEKNVATEVQGVLEMQTCGTNTPKDPQLPAPDPALVMNQVFLPSGQFVLECGPSLRIERSPSPARCADFSSQTCETRDQATSPKKVLVGRVPVEDANFSDDSLESESSETGQMKKRRAKRICNSCLELGNLHSSNALTARSLSQPNISSENCKKLGFRIEKSLEPISRFSISGTNAVYEYDPNSSIADKVIYSNADENRRYESDISPEIVYPQYKEELLKGFPYTNPDYLSSSEEGLTKSFPNESAEDNLSSGTSSGSTGSFLASSETSSEEFVFMENVSPPPPPQPRELYTISENSEPSCSNRSTPVSSRSPRLEKIEEINSSKEDNNKSNETEGKGKKVNWAEMECSGKRQFVNFNYTPSPLGELKRNENSGDLLFPSEDSITFVFLGGKQQQTSVLMELVKRSILGGSDPSDISAGGRSRSRGVQCSSKMMRSVSVDTAVIALSKLARHQRPSNFLHRSTSLSTMSTEVQVDLNSGTNDGATQCDFKEMVDACIEVRPVENGTQCEIDNAIKYSLGTNTTTDRETATDAEQKENTTQTELEKDFDDDCPLLPRKRMDALPADSKARKERWRDMKELILGRNQDLFPHYLEENVSENGGRDTNRQRKTVSWSDFQDRTQKEPDVDSGVRTRRVRFSEPSSEEGRPNTLPRRKQPTTETLAAFIKEATSLLQILHSSPSSGSDEDTKTSYHRSYSKNCLLRRRKKKLSQLKLEKGNRGDASSCDTSVQTDAEQASRFVQTGGFAASLVGPSVKRTVTESFWKEPSENNLNLTWPRRRIASKPPTGLRNNVSPRCSTTLRSGSTSSRLSIASWVGNSHSPSPSISRQNSPSPRRESISPLGGRSSLEETRLRLEAAVEQDRIRQQKFIENIDFCFKNDLRDANEQSVSTVYYEPAYASSGKYWNNGERIESAGAYRQNRPRSVTSQSSSARHYEPAYESPRWKQNYDENDSYSIGRDSPRGNSSYKKCLVEINSASQRNTRESPEISKRENERPQRRGSFLSSQSPQVFNSSCRCSCHKGSGVQACHTCCVPCSTEPKRLYKSEPALNFSCDCSGSIKRPSAHLQHLIALRKSIVASQNNFK